MCSSLLAQRCEQMSVPVLKLISSYLHRMLLLNNGLGSATFAWEPFPSTRFVNYVEQQEKCEKKSSEREGKKKVERELFN